MNSYLWVYLVECQSFNHYLQSTERINYCGINGHCLIPLDPRALAIIWQQTAASVMSQRIDVVYVGLHKLPGRRFLKGILAVFIIILVTLTI